MQAMQVRSEEDSGKMLETENAEKGGGDGGCANLHGKPPRIRSSSVKQADHCAGRKEGHQGGKESLAADLKQLE